ncbi:ABC transporter permease [Pseudalkalibacillus decolorationis]|uniref:ABC transporter permease n=1 Tax=Pseudalkalibacillus decolorationis TaxID=163879 RepID=UPI002147F29B|nr:ABC transporter permease [Pseudalkalibacillus decolorationis]
MIKALHIEFLKIKRSKLLILATFLPLFAALQGGLFAVDMKGKEEDLWHFVYLGAMTQFSWFIFPLLITIILSIIARIEHHHDGWKQLFSLPVERENVYFSKLLIGFALIIYSVIVYTVGLIIAGISVGADSSIPYDMIVQRPFLVIVASLPIIAIQFYVSMRFSHVGVPLMVGIGLALPSMLIANSAKYWIYYPWTYPITSALTDTFGPLGKAEIMYTVCGLSFVVITAIGLIQFRTKDII